MRSRGAVRLWLFSIAGMIWLMVLIGGATRLTGSGLSITEWAPILGTIPPLTDAAWAAAFAKYQAIPQFRLVNADMTLDEFQFIYAWEWGHRFLGRVLGLAYAVPLIFFLAVGRIGRAELPRHLAILAIGACQGLIGWWMVSSGLVDRVSVAPLRLAVHLTLAAGLFAMVLATALTLDREMPAAHLSPGRRIGAAVVLGWVFVQIFLGALVAGNGAGLVYDTWPLMGDSFVPGEIFELEPVWLNFIENTSTVQFFHRTGAYVLFALALGQFVSIVVSPRGPSARVTGWALVFVVAFQMLVGIATLLLNVPLSLALVHQGMAMLVLAAAVVHAVTVFAPGRAEVALGRATSGF
jgi:cytochrome c oxidase assembly protein subunit 15